jgi:iron complex outermembrane receptor protein
MSKHLLLVICTWTVYGTIMSGQGNPDEADSAGIVFELGEVAVVGKGIRGQTLSLESEELQEMGNSNVAAALARLPGLNMTKLGPKNEFMVTVRGFDLRQVPVYLDGVPVQVSYDGYADLARFLVSDLSRITVTKGETSLLAGPNIMGGAINLVSRVPAGGFGFEAASSFTFDRRGYGGLSSEINTGSMGDKFFFQMGLGLVSMKPFARSARADSIDSGEALLQPNSQHEDVNASLKVGFTPNGTDSYVLSVILHDGSKGVPPYIGNNPVQRVRYWRYPEIRRMGVHLNTKSRTGKNGYVQTRWYYDDYISRLERFDDSSYTDRDLPSSFATVHDAETMGGTVIYGVNLPGNHRAKASVHGIYEHHREFNAYPVEEQPRHFIDFTGSAAVEDTYRVNDKLSVLASAGFHFKQNLRADDYLARSDSVFPYASHQDGTFNLLAGVRYLPVEEHGLHLNFSRRSRFSTMKDRYSYHLGNSIPNPDLSAEYSWNTDLGYNYRAGEVMHFSTTLFYSRLQNTIQPVHGVDPDNSAIYQFQNTGDARFYGWEIGFDWMPMTEIGIGMQYTFTDRENMSHPDIHFTDVPRHAASGYFAYTVYSMLDFTFSGLYNSQRISTTPGTFLTDPFFILDFSMELNVQSYVMELAVANMFDNDFSYLEGYPAPGRQIRLGFRTSIDGFGRRDR